MIPYLQLIRIGNLSVILFAQLLIFAFLPKNSCFSLDFDFRILLILISTTSIAAAGYVINDYFDVKIDAINKPENLVVGKHVKRREAIAIHILLNTIGIALGFIISIKVGIFYMLMAALLLLYSSTLKRHLIIGNLTMAGILGLSVFVMWLFDQGLSLNWILFYSIFAFLAAFSREIIEDIEDYKGDKHFNLKSIPVVFGVYPAKITAQVFQTIIGVALPVAAFFFFVHSEFISAFYMVFVLLPFSVFIMFRIKHADKSKDFKKLSLYQKVFIFTGILSIPLKCL